MQLSFKPVDLHVLYQKVTDHGGMEEVISKKVGHMRQRGGGGDLRGASARAGWAIVVHRHNTGSVEVNANPASSA